MKNKKEEKLDYSLKLIVKTSLIVFVGLVLSKIFTYGYRIVVARQFGPEVYGLLALALIVLNWLTIISFLGLHEGVLRFFSFYRGKNEISKINYIFRLSLIILTITSILSTIILFAFSNFISINIFHDKNLIIFLKWFSLIIPFSVFSYLFIDILKSFEKVGWASFIENIFQNFIKLAVLVVLILVGLNFKTIIYSQVAGMIITFIVAFWICKYKLPQIFRRYRLNQSKKLKIRKELFSYSWPLLFFGILSYLFYGIDSFVIGYFKGSFEVGLYNAAVPIAALLYFASNIFIQMFFPLITKEFARKNFEIIGEMSKQVTKWIFILNLPLLILMIFFPGAILNILFGQEYMVAKDALRFLSIGAFIFSVLIISNNLLYMLGKSKLILTDIIASTILNVILNILLVPKYGINGAAFATMISYIILSLLFLLQAGYYASIIPFRRKILRIILVTIVPVILVYYSRFILPYNLSMLFLEGFLFVLLYFLLILVTGCLDKNDLMILQMLRRKFINK